MAWHNNDGLYIKYGTEKTTPNTVGEYRTNEDLRVIELRIDLTDVGSSATILGDQTFVPVGFRIEEIEVVTETAADSSGDAAVLNLGLIKTDRSTEYDYNGLLAALPQTSIDAEGEKTVYRVGTTYAGALVGDVTEYKGLFCADYDTAAFTAGVIKVKVKLYRP